MIKLECFDRNNKLHYNKNFYYADDARKFVKDAKRKNIAITAIYGCESGEELEYVIGR